MEVGARGGGVGAVGDVAGGRGEEVEWGRGLVGFGSGLSC